MNSEFSFRTRKRAIDRFKSEVFDLLVVGGGITGAAVARDAVSRGLKVALVEKNDFAFGTSSASSKLIHGGLRYLENFEFKLVFEALSERAHLLRTTPNMVRPLKFYLPVYKTDPRGKNILSLGLWLYDTLALFRAPGFHKRLSREQMIAEVPGLKTEGLTGGFIYYDASMWDDVMVVETARAASAGGAAVANYVEAVKPVWKEGMIRGFHLRDIESSEEFSISAHRTVICAGPWTDLVGEKIHAPAGVVDAALPEYLESDRTRWKNWLSPSRGVHLVFDKKRFPMKGAMVMPHPVDGRISFVIPREDFGSGVVVVGTTDGPSPSDPEKVRSEKEDVDYILGLLGLFFPELGLTEKDILSSYVGVRPLVDPKFGGAGEGGGGLAKVSREHHVDRGPGGTVVVAGGKYTTHRTMAREIVDHTLKYWEEDRWKGLAPNPPRYRNPRTEEPVNPAVSQAMLKLARAQGGISELIDRYGADAELIQAYAQETPSRTPSPEGFPLLPAQLRYAIEHEMVLHLEDFYFRRLPLYLSRKDHAEPWMDELSRVWSESLDYPETVRLGEIERLKKKIATRNGGFPA